MGSDIPILRVTRPPLAGAAGGHRTFRAATGLVVALIDTLVPALIGTLVLFGRPLALGLDVVGDDRRAVRGLSPAGSVRERPCPSRTDDVHPRPRPHPPIDVSRSLTRSRSVRFTGVGTPSACPRRTT